MQMSAAQNKPVAVVFAPAAWSKLLREDNPSADVAKLLADQFIPCYIDTSSPNGKSLAQTFELKGATGLVLSDKTGASQAFWHQGDMDNQHLAGYLRKYANPDLVVRSTETVSARVSSYPAASTNSVLPAVPAIEPISAPATTSVLAWVNNYHQAQEMGLAQRKPLAVVFGNGPNGWSKTNPSATVEGLLADNYVGVYIDTASPEGKKLADSFAINGNTGLVLSDRTGGSQAFWHQGDLSNQQMVSYLTKYADPQVALRGTETVNSSVRQSNYPSANYAPVDFTGQASPFGSSYCPSCNNARGRR